MIHHLLLIIHCYKLVPWRLACDKGRSLLLRVRIKVCLTLRLHFVLRTMLVKLMRLATDFGCLRSLMQCLVATCRTATVIIIALLIWKEYTLAMRMAYRVGGLLLARLLGLLGGTGT